MRKQYYFRPSSRGYYAWDVDRLVRLTAGFTSQKVQLSDIAELDEPITLEGTEGVLTYRQLADDFRLVQEADLSFPIILAADRRVMDGMHRVVKALSKGMGTIDAVIFEKDPEPDYVDVYPSELPY